MGSGADRCDTTDPHASCAGVVLAGGRSTRMGSPKAALRLRGVGGPTLLEDRMALLSAVADPVWVAAAYGTAPGADRVVDDVPDAGPLQAVAAALRRAARVGKAWVLVLAVDMPNVPEALMRRLWAARVEGGVAFAAGPDGRMEPLVSIWDVQVEGEVARRFSEGERAVHRVASALPHAAVRLGAAERHWLDNLNTPSDVEVWRRGR